MLGRERPPAPLGYTYGHWALLACVFAANLLLAFFWFDPVLRTALFLGGIVLPLVLWRGYPPVRPDQGEFWDREFLPPPPFWVWGIFFLAVGAVRFWRIEDLFVWPTGDEGLCGLAGIELSRQWKWDFFYTAGQDPPTIFWMCGLFFKATADPFFSLWGPPALFSFLSVVAAYFAARQFFSRSFAFLCTGLFAFTYWSLYLGRAALPASFLPLWWIFVLFCLGKHLRSTAALKVRWAFILGTVNGLNTFTFTSWPFFSFAIGVTVLLEWWGRRPRDLREPLLFMTGSLLGLLPFLIGVFREGFGHHIADVGFWHHPEGWSHLFTQLLNYLMVLGWGTFQGDNYCAPVKGGFLNPILSLFFFLGLADALRRGAPPIARWLVFWGLFFLVPGFFSLNMDGNRVVQILPLVVVVTAAGFWAFMENQPRWKKWVSIGAILLFSLVFDLVRLWGPHFRQKEDPGGAFRTGYSQVRYKAYEILRRTAREEGHGIVLGEWDLSADRTLQWATYPFNAAENPDLDASAARWLAVLADIHFKPFLERRFPKGRFSVLTEGPSATGNHILCILPMDPYQGSLWGWVKADHAFAALNVSIDQVHSKDGLARMDQRIRENYPLIQGDPFLEACFWEKVGSFYYYYEGHFQEHLRAAQLAVERGYPASHLYFGLAGLWKFAGEEAKVQEALQKARRSEARYPWR